MNTWSGHWHGYGPWTGTRDEYDNDALRRPGSDLSRNDPATQAFITGSLPPEQTGHALLRRPGKGRTWTDVADALAWLERTYLQHPPIGDVGLSLRERLRYGEDALSRGSDVVWAYYVAGNNYVSYQVVCCPHRFLPNIGCPRPPM